MNNDWKSKYLDSLDRQEAREGLWSERFDLLRRSLVRTSMAAEGNDRTVDNCMLELRELLRHQKNLDYALTGLVPRLEKALLVADQRREERVQQVARAIQQLIEQLRQLPLPEGTNRTLKQLSKKLDQRVGHFAELPLLLQELSRLQGVIIQHSISGTTRNGLLQRLFGRSSAPESEPAAVSVSNAAPEASPVVPPANTAPPAAALPATLPVNEPSEGVPKSVASSEQDEADGTLIIINEYGLPASPEPAYSVIAERVETILLGLLNDLELPEPQQAQSQAIQSRIQQGLNWYELVPVLDDLAVMLRGLFGFDPSAYEAHIDQLNQCLESTQDNLLEAQTVHSECCHVADALDTSLREQTDGLQQQIQHALEINTVKQAVAQSITSLRQTVDHYQQQRQQVEARLNGQLQGLREQLVNIEKTNDELRERLEAQRQQAMCDTLTGLPNRAALSDRLAAYMARCQAGNSVSLLLAVLDIDHFKQINDTYGHLAGDKVLRIIANKWQHQLRKTDFIARYGGEEFVVLMPDTPLTDGQQLLNELRLSIADCPFHFKGERIRVTASAGLAQLAPQETAEQAFERADQALYRAKEGGRNRIELG